MNMRRPFTLIFFIFASLLLLFSACDDPKPIEADEDQDRLLKKGQFQTNFDANSEKDSSAFAQEDSLELKEDSLLQIAATPEMKLYLFEKNGLYGYKDEQNAVVLEAQYQMANDFVNGMAEVVDAEGWAYINGRAEVLARPFIYDNGPDYFQEGLARFVEEGKIGFLNEQGQKQISAQFDFARPFSGGLSAACMGCKEEALTTESGEHMHIVGGKWGFINTKGEWLIPCEYEAVQDFENAVGAYQKDGKWIKIDPKGVQL
jgi:hypothetical protein